MLRRKPLPWSGMLSVPGSKQRRREHRCHHCAAYWGLPVLCETSGADCGPTDRLPLPRHDVPSASASISLPTLQQRTASARRCCRYCKPKWKFPKQDVAIAAIVELISSSASPSTLFLIATYNVGKERALFHLQLAHQQALSVKGFGAILRIQ